MLSAGFILTSLIVVLIPGTGVIYTVTTSLSGNRRSAVWAAAGCTLGIVPHILAGVLGISAIMNTSALLFRVIRILGILYLLYLGTGLIRSRGGIDVQQGAKEDIFRIVGKAVLLNLLNPKLTLFFLSFLPQFVTPHGPDPQYQLILLSLFFMGLTFIVFCIYGLAATAFRRILVSSPIIVDRIQKGFGLILIGFAGKLALED